MNKPKISNQETLQITDTPYNVFDKLVIDLIGPLHKSVNNNTYALTAICDLSKYLIMIPLPNKEAVTIASALMNEIILTFGVPKAILSDRGTEFVNCIVKELCELIKIKQTISTPYRHQTLGSIERNHRVFNEYMRFFLKE